MKRNLPKAADINRLITLTAGSLLLLCTYAMPAYAQETQPNEYSSDIRVGSYGRTEGTISPDPDGTGPLGYPATRTAYDVLGLVVKTEAGELANWQPTGIRPKDWPGFTVFTSVYHSYDTMNRRVKTRVVGSDGQTVSLTQFNTDRQGRPACTAVRMNPAAYASPPPNACDATPNPPAGKEDRISRNIYDSAGQLLQVRKGLGTSLNQAEATYSYTTNGLQSEVIDANGNRARLVYDQHDRQVGWYFPSKTRPTNYNDATVATALTSAELASTTDYEAYTYDKNGNRKTLRKRDGRTITYNYDALNRVVSKTDPDTLTPHVYYGYDNRDLQTYARFGSASGNGIDIVYDGFGRIKETTNKMFATHRKLSYQYDKNGNRTRITHPDNKYFTYDYDKLDRITQIKENGSAVLTTNVYNDRGLPDAMTRTGATTNYSYDAASRASGSVHNLGGTYGDVTYGFGYNSASQIISKSISNKAYITNSHYNIDRQYTTNGLNQYTAAGPATFTYDANGNLTTDGTTTYAYDIENRLVTARGEKEANLIYDPMGRLFETNANSSLAQTTTQFLYDGDALVAEYSDAGTLLHRYVHAGGVDSPVVWYIGATVSTASRSHLHANWQGSITAVTDANASVQWINGYDAYGIPNWFNEGRFQYTGQIMIPELEMYHYKARVYSPTMGRFLQTDPIGYEDQVNLYAYVGNDPVGNIDPSGEQSTTLGGRIAAACARTRQACPVAAVGVSIFGAALTTINLSRDRVRNGRRITMPSSLTPQRQSNQGNEIKPSAVTATRKRNNRETGYHFTDRKGFDAIRNSGVIQQNRGKTYFSTDAKSPAEAHRDLFIGNREFVGKGDYVVKFNYDPKTLPSRPDGDIISGRIHEGSIRNGRNAIFEYLGPNRF